MKIAMIGLGRMGSNMVRRLMKAGHACVVYDRRKDQVKELEKEGATGLDSLEGISSKLDQPAIVWSMLPAGEVTESVIASVSCGLCEGDIIIDGGNSYYGDDVQRSRRLSERGIRYLDVGVSGGVWGLERGYCLMIGGDEGAAKHLDPVFKALAPGLGQAAEAGASGTARQGYLYCGPAGAGHFVKMVHNGIEYGMMQSFAEGFDILHGATAKYRFDTAQIAEVWRKGSVVSSWLLDLIASSLAEDPRLSGFEGRVPDSGEGRWTVQTAIEQGTPAEVIATALFVRFRSRKVESFAEKLLSAMRSEFGGHREAQKKAS